MIRTPQHVTDRNTLGSPQHQAHNSLVLWTLLHREKFLHCKWLKEEGRVVGRGKANFLRCHICYNIHSPRDHQLLSGQIHTVYVTINLLWPQVICWVLPTVLAHFALEEGPRAYLPSVRQHLWTGIGGHQLSVCRMSPKWVWSWSSSWRRDRFGFPQLWGERWGGAVLQQGGGDRGGDIVTRLGTGWGRAGGSPPVSQVVMCIACGKKNRRTVLVLITVLGARVSRKFCVSHHDWAVFLWWRCAPCLSPTVLSSTLHWARCLWTSRVRTVVHHVEGDVGPVFRSHGRVSLHSGAHRIYGRRRTVF